MRHPTRSRRFWAEVASASRWLLSSTPVSEKPRAFWNAFTAVTERSLKLPSAWPE
jgi:hypothetical protein